MLFGYSKNEQSRIQICLFKEMKIFSNYFLKNNNRFIFIVNEINYVSNWKVFNVKKKKLFINIYIYIRIVYLKKKR